MSAPITIRMTLTGSLEGKTKKLNKVQFVKGVTLFTGSKSEIEGITRYFTRSYQVDVKEVTSESLKAEAEAMKEAELAAKPEAVREDDDILGTEAENEERDEKETDPAEPNARQAEIIAAVNCIEREKWVDQQSKTPRPKVGDIQTIMEDPTVTVAEIIEVIKEWLS